MKSPKFISLSLLVFMSLLSGCATRVSRVEPNAVMDLSGRWNDTDSRFVAEAMIQDCLSQRWLFKFKESEHTPTVILGRIQNRSHEHINVGTFIKDIERALLNSGQVDFVANKLERMDIRDEKADMQTHASAVTAKSQFEERGADLMMIGSINTIVDESGRRAVKYYQIDMELVDIESNRKVWMGDKKIKKYIQRRTHTF